jgi:hypothetical protein
MDIVKAYCEDKTKIYKASALSKSWCNNMNYEKSRKHHDSAELTSETTLIWTISQFEPRLSPRQRMF